MKWKSMCENSGGAAEVIGGIVKFRSVKWKSMCKNSVQWEWLDDGTSHVSTEEISGMFVPRFHFTSRVSCFPFAGLLLCLAS